MLNMKKLELEEAQAFAMLSLMFHNSYSQVLAPCSTLLLS
jgi:hypothetical protein